MKYSTHPRYALLSVYNKTNLRDIAQPLVTAGYTLIASAGTGAKLSTYGFEWLPAQTLTRNPDALQDCIQTISYGIAGSILYNRNNSIHCEQVRELDLKDIRVVVCNFPPLHEVVQTEDDFSITRVDVGGPLMVRSAATNYKDVTCIVDSQDYKTLGKKLQTDAVTLSDRKALAIKAYDYCIKYDQTLIEFLSKV